MADILEFGVKLDVSGGAEKAKSELRAVIDQIGKDLGLTVNFEASTESIKALKDSLAELESKTIDIISDEQKSAIQELVTALNALTPILEKVEKAAAEQSKELLKSVSSTTQIALEEEKLAQAKAKTTQETEKAALAASRAADAENKRLLSAERLATIQAKTPNLPTEEYEALFEITNRVENGIIRLNDAFENTSFDYLGKLIADIETLSDTDIDMAFLKSADGAINYGDSIKYVQGELGRATQLQKQLLEEYKSGSISLEQYTSLSKEIGNSVNINTESLNQLRAATKGVGDEIQNVTSSLKPQPIQEYFNDTLDAAKKLAIAKVDLQIYNDALKDLQATYADEGHTQEYIDREAELITARELAKREVQEYTKFLKDFIEINETANSTIQNQEGSYNQLEAQIKRIVALQKTLAPNDPRYAQLSQQLGPLRAQLETIERAQGKLALSSRTWGREVTDLTYAVRLFNPTAGILVQRFQRISVLGQVWNKWLLSLTKNFNISRKAAVGFSLGIAGAVVALGAAAISKIKKFREEQKALQEALNKTRVEAQEYASTLRKSFRDVEGIVNIGFSDTASLNNIKEAADELYKIVSSNEELLPLIESRLASITDERDRLAEIKNIYDDILSVTESQAQVPNLLVSIIGSGKFGTVLKQFEKNSTKANEAINILFAEVQSLVGKGLLPKSFYEEVINIRLSSETIEDFGKNVVTAFRKLEGVGSLADYEFATFYAATQKIQLYGDDVTRGLESISASFIEFYKEFEGETIDFSAENFGLTPEKANRFRIEAVSIFRSFFDQLSEDVKPLVPQFASFFADSIGVAEIEKIYEKPILVLNEWEKALTKNNLYTQEQAKEFTDVHDAGRALAKRYKELEERLIRLRQQYAGANAEGRLFIQTLIDEAEATKEFIVVAQETIGPSTDKIKKASDTRQQELLAEIKAIKEAEDAYKSFRDVFTDIEAQEKTLGLYKEIIKDFKKLPKTTKLQFDGSDYERAVEYALKNAKYLTDKEKLNLKIELSKRDADRVKKDVKKLIDEVNKQIKRQAEANKFFDTIFGNTGDINLAQFLTFKITGEQIKNVRDNLEQSLKAALRDYNIILPVTLEGDVDWNKLDVLLRSIPKEYATQVRNLADQLRSVDMDIAVSLSKVLKEYQSFEEKRNQVAYTSQQSRDNLERLIPETSREVNDERLEYYTKTLDAINNKEKEALASLAFEEFKEGGLWQSTFENVEKIGTRTLDVLIDRVQEFIDTIGQDLPVNEYKELVKTLEKLKQQKIERNPLKAITEGFKEYRIAFKKYKEVYQEHKAVIDETEVKINDLKAAIDDANTSDEERVRLNKELNDLYRQRAKSSENVAKAENKVAAAGNKASKGMENFNSKLQEIASTAQRTNSLLLELAQAAGWVSEDDLDKFEQYNRLLEGAMEIAEGAGNFISGYFSGDIGSMINGIGQSVNGTLQQVIALINIFDKKTKKANKEIERQQQIIEDLEKAHKKLQRARDKALGASSVVLGREQIQNEYEQIEAIQKQIDAERSKGKKKDKKKIKEYENLIEQTLDSIYELQQSLIEDILGSDISSIAANFASSWVDAYFSLEDTFDAIRGEFKQLIRDMIQNTIAGNIINGILQSYFKDITDLVDEQGNVNSELLDYYLDTWESAAEHANITLEDVFSDPRFAGLFGDVETSLQGISKAVASITEDTALALAADLGSIKYYVVGQYDQLYSINELLSQLVNTSGGTNLIDLQNEMLTNQMIIRNNVVAIQNNTASMLGTLNSLITYEGGKGAALKIF